MKEISPNKHFEGALVAAVIATLVGILLIVFMNCPIDYTKAGALITTAAIGGGVGDLFESMLKRLGGKTNSSYLFGSQQGGVLDTFDGFILCAPVGHIIITAIDA